MNRYFLVRIGLVALLTLVVGAVVGAVVFAAPALAQDDGANQTATPETAVGSVGPIDIMDYRLEDGTLTLTLEVNQPTAYALSDSLAGLRQEGVTEVPVKQGTLSEGRQTLSLAVTVHDNAGAVTLSTPADAVRIQTAPVEAGREPVEYGTVQALVAGAVLFGAGGTVHWVRKRRDEEDQEAERLL